MDDNNKPINDSKTDLDVPRVKIGVAARRLGVSPRTLFRMAAQGKLRAWKIGGQVQVAVEDLERLLEPVQGKPVERPAYSPSATDRLLQEKYGIKIK